MALRSRRSSQQLRATGKNNKWRRSVVLFVALIIITSLIFLAGQAVNISYSLGKGEIVDWSFNFIDTEGSRTLSAFKQFQTLLPEKVLQAISAAAESFGLDKNVSSPNVTTNVTSVNITAYQEDESSIKDQEVAIRQTNHSSNIEFDDQPNLDFRDEKNMIRDETLAQVDTTSNTNNEDWLEEIDEEKADVADEMDLVRTEVLTQIDATSKVNNDSHELIDDLDGQKTDQAGEANTTKSKILAQVDGISKPVNANEQEQIQGIDSKEANMAGIEGATKTMEDIISKPSRRRRHRRQKSLQTASKERFRHVDSRQDSQRPNEKYSDFLIKTVQNQLTTGRAYMILAQERHELKLVQDLEQQINEMQDAIGDASTDKALPRSMPVKIRAMESLLSKAKYQIYNCPSTVKKLMTMLHSAEKNTHLLKKESIYLSQIAAKTVPKGLHCLSMRLTVEYNILSMNNQRFPNQEKLDNPGLYHYALFSDNILAAAVVVNSTVMHAKEPDLHVFHIVTDKLNYDAMRMWFLTNPPGNATIEVQNIDTFTWLNSTYSPVLRQLESANMKNYYFKTNSLSNGSAATGLKYRNPKYLSMLNHLRFYLPQIYPKLSKMVFLDDDIIVKRDLSPLWVIDLHGNVNGAVETCGESFHRFDKYLNFSNPIIAKNFDPNACGWAYGMNVFDLLQWKKKDITGIYHGWQKMNEDRTLWKLGTLPPGLITFYNLTYPLEKHWHVLGLGYRPDVPQKDVDKAAVLHFNGNMKPWLEISIPKYKRYWTKYVRYDNPFVQGCNISE